MKLDDLLEEVEHLSAKLDVYVWVDGERYPLTYVDKSFIREGFIELNALVTKIYQPTPEEAAFLVSYCRNVAQASDTEVLFFLERRNDARIRKDEHYWWAGVEDAWLMWQDAKKFIQEEDAKKFTQGESK
jgi:hypothetical protein